MDHHLKPSQEKFESVRLSSSPRRSPIVTQGITSPVRSIHPDMRGLDSIHSPADLGLRTIDFFDDPDDDDEDEGGHEHVLIPGGLGGGGDEGQDVILLDDEGRKGTARKKRRSAMANSSPLQASRCEPKRVSLPPLDSNDDDDNDHGGGAYARLAHNSAQDATSHFTSTPSTSFAGSVEELLSGNETETGLPLAGPTYPRRVARPSSGERERARERAQRSSSHIDPWEDRRRETSIPAPAPVHVPVQQPHKKTDHLLNAYAIAHEITLQALMRAGEEEEDEEGGALFDRSLQSFAPIHTTTEEYRGSSLLPTSLRFNDPRSPRYPIFGTPMPVPGSGSGAGRAGSMAKKPGSMSGGKKVQVVPPPIDTSGPRPSLPADLVRTPYPETTPRGSRRRDFGSPGGEAARTLPAAQERVLMLRIRRSNTNGRPRVTTLVIPVPDAFDTSRVVHSTSRTDIPSPSPSADFDDAAFFHHLRTSYKLLLGPLGLCTAKSLSRILVSGPATRRADAGYGWLAQPRSPRGLAHQGLSDTFSEEKILQHFCRPAMGRQRFAFVHWAHRLAGASSDLPDGEEVDIREGLEGELGQSGEQLEGLEFVLGWSVKRIVLVLGLVVGMNLVAMLLWIFLGRDSVGGQGASGGFRDAGDRVGSGVLVGICGLLVGLSGMAGWLGVSWVVV
ncbi:hypothetical protein LTR62_000883 [Meristemomyces frigidus]|uniref:Uncharacterized protein n=1 Tax=Meristemomyces frigidus TaxID=1508187 RepID=A0AAN7TP72_9PEZI|nr:hypothetical protein LTR62_000883 [Meristemomyces frigidus]